MSAMPETDLKNEGQRRLRALVTPTIKASELARQLKISPAAVSLWVTGENTPTEERAAEIEAITGIPAPTWGKAPRAEKKGKGAK